MKTKKHRKPLRPAGIIADLETTREAFLKAQGNARSLQGDVAKVIETNGRLIDVLDEAIARLKKLGGP